MKTKIKLSQCLFILVIILAAFFRLYNISSLPPGLYSDEAMNGNNGLEALSPGGHFKIFYTENNGREGLFINIQAIFLNFLMPLSGELPQPWMLRLASAIFGILTVAAVYFLAKELFHKDEPQNKSAQPQKNIFPRNEKIALLSSFLLATNFWHINFSRIGFRAIMAPFFLTIGIYFLLKSLNSLKNGNNYLTMAILGGLFYGLGFHSYIAYRATPALILAVLIGYWMKTKAEEKENKELSRNLRKKILSATGAYLLAAAVAISPLGWYFMKHPQDFFGRTAQISVFSSGAPLKYLTLNILKTAGMFNFFGDFNWRHNISGRPELFWPAGILFIIAIFLAAKNLIQVSIFKFQVSGFRFQDSSFYILLAWLVVAALPVVVSNEGMPHALRSILMIPPVFILAGYGGIWLYEYLETQMSNIKTARQNYKFLNPKLLLNVLIFIFFSWTIFDAYYSYFIVWGKNPNVASAFNADIAEEARALNNLPADLPKYIIFNGSLNNFREVGSPLQTIMFLTKTFLPESQKEKNFFYLPENEQNKILAPGHILQIK